MTGMSRTTIGLFVSLVTLATVAPQRCTAQTTPAFFSPAAVVGFDPQIDTVFTGQLITQQAVVSHDRKYVTINTQATSSRLLALQPFAFQNPPTMGFVGSGGAARTNPAAAAAGAGRQNLRQPSILDRPGMTLL